MSQSQCARSSRRGPRGEVGAARAAILAAARSLFLAGDFQSVSLRAIAREAEVDTSLVSYYFGTKQELYLQTISLPSGPHRIIAEACASSSIDELGETLVRSFLTAWPGQGTADQDDRTAGNSMQGKVMSSLSLSKADETPMTREEMIEGTGRGWWEADGRMKRTSRGRAGGRVLWWRGTRSEK